MLSSPTHFCVAEVFCKDLESKREVPQPAESHTAMKEKAELGSAPGPLLLEAAAYLDLMPTGQCRGLLGEIQLGWERWG